MAIVNVNGPLYMDAVLGDPVADGRADNRYAGGRVHSSLERFTITVGDEATSTYAVARMPREAVLLPNTHFRVGDAAVTGTINIGDAGFPAGLVSGNAGAASSGQSFGEEQWVATVTEMGQPLWQLLGYASREAAPAQVDIFITLVGAAQATADAEGYIEFYFTY